MTTSTTKALLAGAPATEGGTGPKPTTIFERQMLAALATARAGLTPDEMRERHPATFGHRSFSSLHLTGASLVRKGWAVRKRRMIRSKKSGAVQGGSRRYDLTPEGRAQL